ncbi:MAG: ATPase [Flavobacteriales bacterium CG18_big_fil_WC_8_21_14_2_50_32_9]|nr:MAG: ATPase [Flavobacteriales bacterium CG18_big_fil_WC_8_21_14_2_50_32_9]PIZ06011.1 MAG: ATPase [Flavobacteriales bacterium CG_4_10_14_0_8_um_filter_32_5]
MELINRDLRSQLLEKWNSRKVLVVIGPRQVGKTTLVRSLCEKEGDYLFINGDDAEDRVVLENAGKTKLEQIIGTNKTVFIDEAQRIKDIGLILKIIYDQIKGVRLIASGSSAFDLANEVNEPLTGRKWEFIMFPLSWNELNQHFGYFQHVKNLEQYLIYGLYPEIVVNTNKEEILIQLSGSYLYKDLLQYKSIRKSDVLDKLLLALALQVGSEVNYNELAQTVGADRATIEQYITLLEKVFVIFRLNPLARNVRNEINTSRKIYFYDNGIRNAIIRNFKPVTLRQDVGALWENYLISERIKFLSTNKINCRYYFWRTYQQQEIDWIEEKDGVFYAYEFKWNPKKTKKKFPVTFTANYKIEKTMVVTPENCHEFLSL